MVGYVEGNILIALNEQDIPVNSPYSPGSNNRFDIVMPTVAARVRTRIQSFPGMVVSATVNAVPPELLDITCKLIAISFATAFPLLLKLEDKQVERWDEEWKAILTDIKKGEFRISEPADGQVADVQVYAPVSVANGRTPEFTLSNPADGSLGTLTGVL